MDRWTDELTDIVTYRSRKVKFDLISKNSSFFLNFQTPHLSSQSTYMTELWTAPKKTTC